MICSIIDARPPPSPFFAQQTHPKVTSVDAPASPLPAAAPPTCPVAPGPECVRFIDEKIKGSGGYAARRTRAFGAMAGLLIVFALTLLVLSYIMPGPNAVPIAAGVTLAVLIARLIWGRVGAEEKSRARAMIDPLAGTGRIRCLGKLKALARIAALGPIEDRMFEPAIFLAVGSTKSPPRKQAVQIVAGALIVLVGLWLEHRFLHRFTTAPYVLFLAGVGGAMLVGAAVYPTYVRVVPGRIDVMECALLGRRIISVRRIDLRTRPVLVDVNRQMLEIGDGGAYERMPFAAIWDRWAFAHAVLMASISTHTPPPLPDDALVG